MNCFTKQSSSSKARDKGLYVENLEIRRVLYKVYGIVQVQQITFVTCSITVYIQAAYVRHSTI